MDNNITNLTLDYEIDGHINNQDYELVISLYVILFIVALVSNVIIIIIVIKDQYMRSVTNYLLVNLAVADLLVTLICMPNAAWNAYTPLFYFTENVCKLTSYFQCVAVAASIFTITAMAIDRYLAIAKPFGLYYQCFTKKTTLVVIIIIWKISAIIFAPMLYISSLHEIEITKKTYAFCTQTWPRDFPSQRVIGTLWFVVMFAIPGVIMSFAYSMMCRTLCSALPPFDINEGASSSHQRNKIIRDRKRVACILLLLAFVFAVCWLPTHLIQLLNDFEVISFQHESLQYLKMYLLLLGHTNSALNPIIYCVLSRKFRKSIIGLCKCQCRCRRESRLRTWQDSSGIHLNYLYRLKSLPNTRCSPNNINLSRRIQSSQKVTTRTYAV